MGTVGTGKSGSRFIKTKYPIEEGLIAGTTKLRKKQFLEAEEKSRVLKTDKDGI